MKKYSWKFWITFWTASAALLSLWYVFLEWRNFRFGTIDPIVGALPVGDDVKDDMRAVTSLADYALQKDGRERVFLILFQNNAELRPGGGYIGSFGILKIRDGQAVDFQVHDSNIFDGRIPDTIVPPYPMKETLRIPSWKFRDSNWSPDFPTNAAKAEEFYRMGEGGERFDGVFAITTEVLSSVLRLTGPIEVPGYPGSYGDANAVDDLQYQVEQAYWKQGRELGERKDIIRILGDEIIRRMKDFGPQKKYDLFQSVIDNLNRKEIQLSFADEALQSRVENAGWSGRVDMAWQEDSLMIVDANLAALKSDRLIDRGVEYTVDLTGQKPVATLAITYKHNGTERDWRTADYQSYLRVYVPKGSWLEMAEGAATAPVYGDDLGRKYFGMLVQVPLGSEKKVVLKYVLPETVSADYYDLKIEKQAGMKSVPVAVHVLRAYGLRDDREFTLAKEWVFSEAK